MKRGLIGFLIVASLIGGGYMVEEGIRMPLEWNITDPGEFRRLPITGGFMAPPGTFFEWITRLCFGDIIPDPEASSVMCKGRIVAIDGSGRVGLNGKVYAPDILEFPTFDSFILSPESDY